jgi:hypothetical protein
MNIVRAINKSLLISASVAGRKAIGLAILLSIALVLFVTGNVHAGMAWPTISGIAPDDAGTFVDNDVELTVYGYSFTGAGSSVPAEITPPLLEGQTLLVYLIHNTTAQQAEADFLQIANPDEVDVISLGAVNSILPSGYQESGRNNPDQYYTGSGENSNEVIRYQWFDVPRYGVYYLQPGEWSLVSMRFLGITEEVEGTGGSTSTGGADELILGPNIPEPTSLAVFLGATAMLILRRKSFGPR